MNKIKKILSVVWSFIKRRKILSFFIALAIVIILLIIIFSGGTKALITATVEKGTVISEVSITGQVKSAQSINLAFQGSGRVQNVSVKVGSNVLKGQTLISLESSDLYAQLSQAQGSLKAQEAKFLEIKKGARKEEIAIKQLELSKAKSDLDGYYDNAINVLNDSYAKTDDALNKQSDQIFYGDNSDNPTLSFSSDDLLLESQVKKQRVTARDALLMMKNDLVGLNSSTSNNEILNKLSRAEGYVAKIRDLLNRITDILSVTHSLSQTDLDAYKLAVNTGRTNVNLAGSNISAQKQLILGQEATVLRGENALKIEVDGATPEQILAQEALVDQAKGQVDYIYSQIAKTVLRAPFDGIITKIIYNPQEIAQANSTAISILGSGKYDAEAKVAESDIAKVKIGDKAKITLDAYGSGLIFGATVTSIDLSETIIEGVATYKAVLQFDEDDKRILPGLTANIDILSDKKEGVIYAPTRNIIVKDGKKSVILVSDKNEKNEIEIKTGLKGSDGRTEIISGLKEGDKILVE